MTSFIYTGESSIPESSTQTQLIDSIIMMSSPSKPVEDMIKRGILPWDMNATLKENIFTLHEKPDCPFWMHFTVSAKIFLESSKDGGYLEETPSVPVKENDLLIKYEKYLSPKMHPLFVVCIKHGP